MKVAVGESILASGFRSPGLAMRLLPPRRADTLHVGCGSTPAYVAYLVGTIDVHVVTLRGCDAVSVRSASIV